MRQTELRLSVEDRQLIEELRSKGLHYSREVNRAHVLSCLDQGVPEAQIMAVLGMGLYPQPFAEIMHASVNELLKHLSISKL